MKDSPLKLKSYTFALRIVKVYQHFKEVQKEYVLSKQLLKSGTAVGALIREAEFAQSSADFINKLHIALKEANETMYWIDILKDSGYMDEKSYLSLADDCKEMIRLLVSSVKTAKSKL